MSKISCSQIANDYDLWGQYVDPQGTMSEVEFDAMSEASKLAIIHDAFPGECNCE
jgi:hypothetical protein